MAELNMNLFNDGEALYNLDPKLDWSEPNEETDNKTVSGKAIQDYIKHVKADTEHRVGYFYVQGADTPTPKLYGFKDKKSYEFWLGHQAENPELILTEVTIPLAQRTEVTYVNKLKNLLKNTTIISTDNTVKITAEFESWAYDPGETEAHKNTEDGTLVVELYNDVSRKWEVLPNIKDEKGNEVTTVGSFNPFTLDLTDKIFGTKRVRIQVIGSQVQSKLATNYITYDITKTNLKLTGATNWWVAQKTGNIRMSYNITGEVEKTLKLKISGEDSEYRTLSYNFGRDDVYPESPWTSNPITDEGIEPVKVITQGVHTVEAWLEVKGTNIESNHVFTEIMVDVDEFDNNTYILINNKLKEIENWSPNHLFDYAVYRKDNTRPTVYFNLTNPNGNVFYSTITKENVEIETKYELYDTLEVEGINEDVINAKMDVCKDLEKKDIIRGNILFLIQNNSGFSPTNGADFILSPRSKNNSDSDKDTIINSAYDAADENHIVKSDWVNFNFNNVDGWIEDDNKNKCLRVLKNQYVNIMYNPFADWSHETAHAPETDNESCTIEMFIATRNVTNMESSILRMFEAEKCNIHFGKEGFQEVEQFNGFKLRPLDGYFLTKGDASDKILSQDIGFQEDEMTHISINIMHSFLDGHNIVRIFINGIINREFEYTESGITSNMHDPKGDLSRIISIGGTGADIDIYGIRVYKKKLDAGNILQNYIAILPTMDMKKAVKDASDILDSTGHISYDKVKNKYNTLLWTYYPGCNAGEQGSDPMKNFTRPAGKEFGDSKKSHQKEGDLIIRILDEGGHVDEKHSGIMAKIKTGGQGTSSMNYWKWNQRWAIDSKKQPGAIFRNDLGEYWGGGDEKGENVDLIPITPKEPGNHIDALDGYVKYIAPEDLKPASDDNGKMKYHMFDNDPMIIKKFDGKINWASPQQSHKLGSTSLYNDLWKTIIKENAISKAQETYPELGTKFTGTKNGYKDCRMTVHQLPFFLFILPGKPNTEIPKDIKGMTTAFGETVSSQPVFWGLYTVGAGKGDKPSFGEDDTLWPEYIMMEGCENAAPLVNHRVPWNSIDVSCPADDGERAIYTWNVNKEVLEVNENWEISTGARVEEHDEVQKEKFDKEHAEENAQIDKTNAENKLWNEQHPDEEQRPILPRIEFTPDPDYLPTPTLKFFKEMCNFVYKLNPNIHGFAGTYKQLCDTDINTLDKKDFYWCQSVEKDDLEHKPYDLYRFDENDTKINHPDFPGYKPMWVDAGVEYVNQKLNKYERLNILDQLKEFWGIVNDPANIKINQKLNQYNFFSLTTEKQNEFLRDRRLEMFKGKDKDSGIRKYFDEDDLMYTMQFLKLIAASDNWAKNAYLYTPGRLANPETGEIAPDTPIEKIRFFQDDLDTIFFTDNSGKKTKPYYVEEYDINLSDPKKEPYWPSNKNGLYRSTDMAFQREERTMMNKILSAMTSIGGSVDGCFDKYYFHVQKYFPATAYNEIAKKLYESAFIYQKKGEYGIGINPLSQCLGDQLQGEKQWIKQRSIYMSSYATFGDFGAMDTKGGNALNFKSSTVNGREPEYEFNLKPYMWLYPSIGVGNSKEVFPDNAGMSKKIQANEVAHFNKFGAGNDTFVYIRGINEYNDIGNFGSVSIKPGDFVLGGKRLESFKVIGDSKNPIVFAPTQLSISSSTNIKDIVIKGNVNPEIKVITSNLDLKDLKKLETVDIPASSIPSIMLPENSNIKLLKLPKTIQSVNLIKQTKLTEFDLPNYSNLNSLIIKDTFIDTPERTHEIFKRCLGVNAKLDVLDINNVNWTDVTLAELKYLLSVKKDNEEKSYCKLQGVLKMKENEHLDLNTKLDLIYRFGNIDDQTNDLYIEYKQFPLTKLDIIGETNITKGGQYKYICIPKPANANDINSITWSVTGSGSQYAKFNQPGILTYSPSDDMGTGLDIKINCTVSYEDRTKVYTKTVYLYERIARLGDYVYADGTYTSAADYNPMKTVVGICIWDDPENRTMVATHNINTKNGKARWGLSDGEYEADTDGIPGITTLDLNVYDVVDLKNYNQAHENLGIGYEEIGSDRVATGTNIDNVIFEKFDNQNYAVSDKNGYLNTNTIIKHRNAVLSDNSISKIIPGEDGKTLDELINNSLPKEDAYYFPAASYCYEYEPKVKEGEVLDNKFKKSNWYLPCLYELLLISWFHGNNRNEKMDISLKIFKKPVFDHIFTPLAEGRNINTYCSSNETNGYNKLKHINTVYGIEISGEEERNNGNRYVTPCKSNYTFVRPVAKF